MRDRVGALLACGASWLAIAVDAIFSTGDHYYLVGILIMLFSLVPFLIPGGRRRTHTRELVFIAAMSIITMLLRILFIWVPSFKPLVAGIVLAGVALGASAGFLTATTALFISNFIFGHGMWTPWQMVAYGLTGVLAGILADAKLLPRHDLDLKQRLILCLVTGLMVLCLVGPILDTYTIFSLKWMIQGTPLEIYRSGFPVNLTQAVAAMIGVFILANPILDKLHRARLRFGLMDWAEGRR